MGNQSLLELDAVISFEEMRLQFEKLDLKLSVCEGKLVVTFSNKIALGYYETLDEVRNVLQTVLLYNRHRCDGNVRCKVLVHDKDHSWTTDDPDEIPHVFTEDDLVLEVNIDEIKVLKDRSGKLRPGLYQKVAGLQQS